MAFATLTHSVARYYGRRPDTRTRPSSVTALGCKAAREPHQNLPLPQPRLHEALDLTRGACE